MKNILLFFIVITASFVPKPPTFVQDMEAFDAFMVAKETQLAESASTQDSAAVFAEISGEIAELKSKWDLEEQERLMPPIGYTVCMIRCTIGYAMCHDPGGCYTTYLYCRFGCNMAY